MRMKIKIMYIQKKKRSIGLRSILDRERMVAQPIMDMIVENRMLFMAS
jgi:hypothetical protein